MVLSRTDPLVRLVRSAGVFSGDGEHPIGRGIWIESVIGDSGQFAGPPTDHRTLPGRYHFASRRRERSPIRAAHVW